MEAAKNVSLFCEGKVLIQVPGMQKPHYCDNAGIIHMRDMSQWFSAVYSLQGSQILRVPENSSIKNIRLSGGASADSGYAVLRGAVLKFSNDRADDPLELDGRGFVIPSGHTLMDWPSLQYTIKHNSGEDVPYDIVRNICWRTGNAGQHVAPENMYLVHSSYCHPDQLFFRKGLFAKTLFSGGEVPEFEHGKLERGILFLNERDLPDNILPANLLSSMRVYPSRIRVRLNEGGVIDLIENTLSASFLRYIYYTFCIDSNIFRKDQGV
jgi:hypothetical protein